MSDAPLLKVENLSVRFAMKGGGLFGKKQFLHAVDDVSFEVAKGETLAIVGESGSGKTTAALAVARLVDAWQGRVNLDGQDVLPMEGEELRQLRHKVSFIFQDPYSSLNPRQRAEDVVREPLASLTGMPRSEQQKVVDDLFAHVGLRPEQKRLFPHQFSGGQRQRIGVARALATRPALIICDEPVSALDVAVQAQILNLLRRLQKEYGLAYLFISHDLGVIQHMCDTIAVMYMGKVMEYADRLSLFNNPQHPYTMALLSAVPSVDKKRREQSRPILIPGDPPNPLNLPKGCRFASRCPAARDICRQEEPSLDNRVDKHQVACHLGRDEAKAAIDAQANES